MSDLIDAAREGELEKVKKLIKNGDTALMCARFFKYYDIAKVLIEYGADIY